MKVVTHDLEFYTDRIRKKLPFAFARYGNGEWGGIFRTAERTGTGSQDLTIPSLRSLLRESITWNYGESRYFLALQSLPYLKRCGLLERIEKWTEVHTPGCEWHNGEVFHRASKNGILAPFVKELRNHRVVVVGPPHLRKLPFYDHFIEVPRIDGFSAYEQTLKAVKNNCKDVVILFSAGPMAKCLIHQTWEIANRYSYLIDTGSLWDPYCGVRQRSYHRLVTPELVRKNLGK